MRTLIALVISLSISTAAAWAVVEGQVAGSWKTADGSVLQIQTDGNYSKLSGGRVIETGIITALDGKWNLRSSTGKLDSGTFSIIGGALTLRSSIAGTTSWSRATGSTSAPQTASKSSPPYLNSSKPSWNKPTDIATAPSLQSSVSMDSQLPTSGTSSRNSSSYPAPVAVPSETPPSRGVKGGLKSFASAIQQAATDGYNSGAFTGNSSRRYSGDASVRNITATMGGARRMNFSQPRSQGQGAPDPFLLKGGSFRDPGDGHGTYSAMKKNWEQQQMASLPPVKPIPTASDETLLYGVPAFEKRALGPAVPYRIKFLGLE